MTARIKRTDSPGESASEASGSSPVYGSGPQNFLDNARINARTAAYPNSAAETAHVAAVDAAAFDRVHKFEAHLIANAEVTVVHSRAVNAEADDISKRLYDLATQVQRGRISASDAAVEFETLRREAAGMRGRIVKTLHQVETDEAKVTDPYNHAQRIMSKMPVQSVRPLNPSAFM